MKISNILEAKNEAIRFLNRLKEVEESDTNGGRFKKTSTSGITYSSKETGALKRASMDLTRSLAKMRNNIW